MSSNNWVPVHCICCVYRGTDNLKCSLNNNEKETMQYSGAVSE